MGLPASLFWMFFSVAGLTTSGGVHAGADVLATFYGAEGSQAPPGPYVTANIAIYNSGPDAATNAVLELTPPPGTTFDFVSPTRDCVVPTAGTAGTLRCTFVSLPPENAFTRLVRLRAAPPAVDTIFPLTIETSSDTPDPDPANNTASAPVLAQSADARADISVTALADPSPLPPGTTLVHDITVTNHGPDPANYVRVIFGYPSGFNPSFDPIDGWNCGTGFPTIPPPIIPGSCSTSIMEPGSVTLRLRTPTHPLQTAPIQYAFHVQSQTSDPEPSNNVFTVTTPFGIGEGVAVPDLTPALLALLAALFAAMGVRASPRHI